MINVLPESLNKNVILLSSNLYEGNLSNYHEHLSNDNVFSHFDNLTYDNILIMSEKAYLSLSNKSLPYRLTIVISDNPKFNSGRNILKSDLNSALNYSKKFSNSRDIFLLLDDYNIDDIDVITHLGYLSSNLELISMSKFNNSFSLQEKNIIDNYEFFLFERL